MEKMKDLKVEFTQYKKGEIITGTIVMITKVGAIVNIGGMRDGIVPINELEPIYKEGDAILTMFTGVLADNNCYILKHEGVAKILEEKEKLNGLKLGASIKFMPNEITQSGVIGNYLGYRVFLPFSQCRPKDYVSIDNKNEIDAIVIELDNLKKSIVVSTKLVDRGQDEVFVHEGEEYLGKVFRVYPKYAIIFLSNGVKAKLSVADYSYDRIDDLTAVLKEGEQLKFKIIKTNADNSRTEVGVKQLFKDPAIQKLEELKIGQRIMGKVVKVLPNGAVFELDNGLNAFAYTKDNTDRANVETHYLYKLGKSYETEISNINKLSKKITVITNFELNKKD